jgi:hypothetical protein
MCSKYKNLRGENCGQFQCIDRSGGTKEDRQYIFEDNSFPVKGSYKEYT